jgi:hypothetical protein
VSNLSQDFVTVDMRGLKTALVALARSERASVSALMRRAVARELDSNEPSVGQSARLKESMPTKVSIRLTAADARQLAERARADGVSMGALLAGLAAGIPSSSGCGNRRDTLAALVESSAELATLNRNVHHLTCLLAKGSVQAAQEYRATLQTLEGEVRGHLRFASAMLAELGPRRMDRNAEAGGAG